MKNFRWSNNLAYAVGLIATDGNLSKDGRHLEFTSKDIEQINNFKKCLNLDVKISWKTSGFSNKKYPRIQFSNIRLYKWFVGLGLEPNKSLTLGILKISDKYFFDYLRGYFDGDGCFYSYWDTRWKKSFMFYFQFSSASKKHLQWINERLKKLLQIDGIIIKKARCFNLVYAKNASKLIIKKLYKGKNCICLSRKKTKIFKALKVGMTKLVDVQG